MFSLKQLHALNFKYKAHNHGESFEWIAIEPADGIVTNARFNFQQLRCSYKNFIKIKVLKGAEYEQS